MAMSLLNALRLAEASSATQECHCTSASGCQQEQGAFLLSWAAVMGLEISRAAERFGCSKAFTFYVHFFDCRVGMKPEVKH